MIKANGYFMHKLRNITSTIEDTEVVSSGFISGNLGVRDNFVKPYTLWEFLQLIPVFSDSTCLNLPTFKPGNVKLMEFT